MKSAEEIITNPITSRIQECLVQADSRILIAVPFISSFAKKILRREDAADIADKRILTRFDDTNINTFNIPALLYLLKECGFVIRYNNNIHLKQYIIDSGAFVTSSNLTRGGFEDNIELTVWIDSDNVEKSKSVFEDLWKQSASNIITEGLLDDSLERYNILKKRTDAEKSKNVVVSKVTRTLDMQALVDEVFRTRVENPERVQLIYEASKNRTRFKEKLLKDGFEVSTFYAPEGHQNRRKNLFYEFVYGTESRLAGTGLREAQFEDVFCHPDFKQALYFLYPEMIQSPPWNLDEKKAWQGFCEGLFDFDIPQYKEALPIRLASYFYPDKFLPIFKLNDLENVCNALGISTNAKSRGERLFAYSSFLEENLKDVPVSNYIKSEMAYHLLHTLELYDRLDAGEKYCDIRDSYKQQWRKYYIEKGKHTLESIGMIKKS